MPQAFRQPGLWRRRSVIKRRVWSDGVVVNAPPLSQHPDFLHRVEDFSVQELVPQLRVEALTVAVLPRGAGFDVQRFSSSCSQSFAQIPGHELGAVIRTKVLRNSFHDHYIGQSCDDPSARPAPFASDHQTLPAVFIDQVQHPNSAPIVRPGADEIVAPYMTRTFWPEPHAPGTFAPRDEQS